jgi:hypothetical protein
MVMYWSFWLFATIAPQLQAGKKGGSGGLLCSNAYKICSLSETYTLYDVLAFFTVNRP